VGVGMGDGDASTPAFVIRIVEYTLLYQKNSARQEGDPSSRWSGIRDDSRILGVMGKKRRSGFEIY